MALGSDEKKEIISKFARKKEDTGSPEVQIALLTTRIKTLTEHLKINKKDHSSRVGLFKMVGQRKKLLGYLKKTNQDKFLKVANELEIKIGNI